MNRYLTSEKNINLLIIYSIPPPPSPTQYLYQNLQHSILQILQWHKLHKHLTHRFILCMLWWC